MRNLPLEELLRLGGFNIGTPGAMGEAVMRGWEKVSGRYDPAILASEIADQLSFYEAKRGPGFHVLVKKGSEYTSFVYRSTRYMGINIRAFAVYDFAYRAMRAFPSGHFALEIPYRPLSFARIIVDVPDGDSECAAAVSECAEMMPPEARLPGVVGLFEGPLIPDLYKVARSFSALLREIFNKRSEKCVFAV